MRQGESLYERMLRDAVEEAAAWRQVGEPARAEALRAEITAAGLSLPPEHLLVGHKLVTGRYRGWFGGQCADAWLWEGDVWTPGWVGSSRDAYYLVPKECV